MSVINGRIALGERTNLNDACFSPSKGVKTGASYAATIMSAKSPAGVSLIKAGGSEAKIIDDASKEIEELAESIAAVRVEEDEEVDLGSETEEEDPDFECSEEEESDEEYEDEEEEDEEEEDEEDEEDVEDAVPPPMTVAESSERICHVFDELKNEIGVEVFPTKKIQFGKQIGKGAFGTVRLGVCVLDGSLVPVAVKTIVAFGANFKERLECFETEARVGWQACREAREGKASRVVRIYGIAHDVTGKNKSHLHLVMERVEDAKDLHEKIHEDGNWTDIRVDGVDTGARLKTNYTWEDSDGDLSCYAMKRSLKVHFAIEMGRIAAELERVDILHCDIKPCNFLVSKSLKKGGMAALRLIDFGEGNTTELAAGFIAGTPGYQAPEVLDEGMCSMWSEMYSIGVSLIELWAGRMWDGADTRGEGPEGMKDEMLAALAKIQKSEPRVAKLLRKCVDDDLQKRPSPKRFVKEMFRIKTSMMGGRKDRNSNKAGNGADGKKSGKARSKARRGKGKANANK